MSLPPGQSLSWLDMAAVVTLVVREPPPLLYTWKDRLEKAQQEQRVDRGFR